MVRTFTGPAPGAEAAWTSAWKQADIGAANGHGNARSVARVQSAITNGGVVGGRPLLSPATIERIFEVQSDNVDLVLGVPRLRPRRRRVRRGELAAADLTVARCRRCVGGSARVSGRRRR